MLEIVLRSFVINLTSLVALPLFFLGNSVPCLNFDILVEITQTFCICLNLVWTLNCLLLSLLHIATVDFSIQSKIDGTVSIRFCKIEHLCSIQFFITVFSFRFLTTGKFSIRFQQKLNLNPSPSNKFILRNFFFHFELLKKYVCKN